MSTTGWTVEMAWVNTSGELGWEWSRWRWWIGGPATKEEQAGMSVHRKRREEEEDGE